MEFTEQEAEAEPVHDDTPPLAYGASSRHSAPSSGSEVTYHECLRNHAAALGGHVVDGCGEFMPAAAADGGGILSLKCAACGCHRSFHRKDEGQLLTGPAPPTTPRAPPRVPLLLPPPPPPPQHRHPYAAGALHAPPFPYHHHHAPSGSGGGTTTTESSSEERGTPSAQRRKRFRTRFTPEQKEQMLAFAERVGWRMQKQDEALVDQFCAHVGVRRHVLKVWMHNNKSSSSSSRRQQSQQQQQQQ